MVAAKDKNKFKSCAKSPFCTEHRNQAQPEPEATLLASQIKCDGTTFTAPLKILETSLSFEFYLTKSGAVRVGIDEQIPRWKAPGVLVESGIAKVSNALQQVKTTRDFAEYKLSDSFTAIVEFSPFKFTLLEKGKPTMVVNGFKELYYKTDDVVRSSKRKKLTDGRKVLDWGEDGKPIFSDEAHKEQEVEDDASSVVSMSGVGNEVGVDISFVNSKGVFGIPERTVPFLLPNTKDSEPYRLYNLDVFAYEINDPMGLYGNVPIMVSKGSGSSSTAIFWNNPSDTFIDLSDETLEIQGQITSVRKSKWMSEAGNFDLIIYPGETLTKVMKQIRDTTGPQILPPMFSLGYHQCRWNYNDQKDFLQVNQGFEEHNIPMDVLWLDIGHTDGRRYFTFDKKKFPDPIAMYKEIDFYGRKAVNIVDPHIKRDDNYLVHQVATKEGFYIKDHDGKDFDGWCWPGSSSYIDFSHEPARKFWASMFDTEKYKDTINGVVHIWNDMNEPAVFNTEEVTMPKDCKNVAGADFRELHNVWGMLFHASSQAGLLHRDLAEQKIENDKLVWRNLDFDEARNTQEGKSVTLQRGFVLSRAFYAGTQRAGAIWTGDNAAEWSHLQVTGPMLLSLGMAGISFVGSDVGGFFGDPEPELLIRWYQAACLQPFFRGHAHIDTKRREPWLFGKENTDRIRAAIALRYTFLPFIYTAFHITEKTGLPVMRPLFMTFENNEALLGIDDQWTLSDSLLVAPVFEKGAKKREVIFPKGVWYDVQTYQSFNGGKVSFDVNMETILAFARGGSIIPRKTRMRRATKHMANDPYTLLISLDEQKTAKGELYIDDELTYDYADKKAYCTSDFSFSGKVFTSTASSGNQELFKPDNQVERIVILGAKDIITVKTAKVVTPTGESEVEVLRENNGEVIVVRNPKAKISDSFTVSF